MSRPTSGECVIHFMPGPEATLSVVRSYSNCYLGLYNDSLLVVSSDTGIRAMFNLEAVVCAECFDGDSKGEPPP